MDGILRPPITEGKPFNRFGKQTGADSTTRRGHVWLQHLVRTVNNPRSTARVHAGPLEPERWCCSYVHRSTFTGHWIFSREIYGGFQLFKEVLDSVSYNDKRIKTYLSCCSLVVA